MYLSVATDARLPYMGRPADVLVRDAAELGPLTDVRRWADAVRRLGGEPTTLVDLAALWDFIGGERGSPWVEPGAYVALRDAGEDGRRVLRAVAVPAG
jgi:hypothetical protein